MKAKIYENQIKVDVIEFDDIDELKRKFKKKWG
jgi:hypothetical protein